MGLWWFFVIMGPVNIVGGLVRLLSPKLRRQGRALSRYAIADGCFAVGLGFASIAAGVSQSFVPFVAVVPPAAVLNVLQRRDLAGREVPPALRRMLDVPLNPLKIVRHPVAYGRAAWAAFGHPFRRRAETKAWLDERGL